MELLDNLRRLPPPSHALAGAVYPPTALLDNYSRGQYGLVDIKSPPVHASVLVPLALDPSSGELTATLTLRTRRLKRHSGEVALPGGKRDQADGGSDRVTALREASEEIGLGESDVVEVLAELERPVAVGGLIMGVVVAVVRSNFHAAPNLGEVEAVFTMPLRAFLEGGERYAYRSEDLPPTAATAEAASQLQRPMRMHWFTQREPGGAEYLVWGLTSSILIHVAELVYGEPTAFEKDGPLMQPQQPLRPKL